MGLLGWTLLEPIGPYWTPFGIGKVSGLHGSICLVEVVWLLSVPNFLKPYGLKLFKMYFTKNLEIYKITPGAIFWYDPDCVSPLGGDMYMAVSILYLMYSFSLW